MRPRKPAVGSRSLEANGAEVDWEILLCRLPGQGSQSFFLPEIELTPGIPVSGLGSHTAVTLHRACLCPTMRVHSLLRLAPGDPPKAVDMPVLCT